MSGPSAFDRDTVHRLLTEAMRVWCITNYLSCKEVPIAGRVYVYPDCVPACMDWGANDVMKGKRIKVTFEVEDH